MGTGRRKGFWSDDGGAVILEMTVTITLFLVVLFGTIEAGNLFYQWNVATKATQLGARLAAISNPVAANLTTLNGMETGLLPGDPLSANYFDCTCSGATGSCTGTRPGGNCGWSLAAMNAIVYGRGDAAVASGCGNAASGLQLGMCDVYDRIRPANVVIRYQHTGLGYAGRPGAAIGVGGMVPTITVSLVNLPFNWVALDGLLGLGPIAIPGLRTTITGEDLSGS